MSKSKKADRELRSIQIDEKLKVKIKFVETVMIENPGDGEPASVHNKYGAEGGYKPHPDLIHSLKVLLPFALEVAEMEVNAKKLKDYTVSGFKIKGDVGLQNSSVTLVISKIVRRTNKVVTIITPQVTMYGESEYANAAKMTKGIEKAINETWEYIAGKYQADQLPLFK